MDLINLIKKNDLDGAIAILSESDLGVSDNLGNTALILACSMNMPKLALLLIGTGKSQPYRVNCYNMTALMFACLRNISEVALALISTKNSNISQIDDEGDTALILACRNSMSDVAIALIESGKCIPDFDDHDDEFIYLQSVICIGFKNNMKEVCDKLSGISRLPI